MDTSADVTMDQTKQDFTTQDVPCNLITHIEEHHATFSPDDNVDPKYNITSDNVNTPIHPQPLVTTDHGSPQELVTIDPTVSHLMADILDNIEHQELLELQDRLSKPKSVNKPNTYSPTILIPSPNKDPEKITKTKRSEQEYDPLHPAINILQCDQCSKEFKSKGTLRRHVQANHTKEAFECDICFKKLYRKDSVRRHYRTHHKEAVVPEHLVVSHTDSSKPSKLVRFNLKSKTEATPPVSQFANTDRSETNNNNNDLIRKLVETLQSYQK
jgi:hypothetical protein